MVKLSNQPAGNPLGSTATKLLLDIQQLTKSHGQAQSSGDAIAARMIELDWLGLMPQFIQVIGSAEQAQKLIEDG